MLNFSGSFTLPSLIQGTFQVKDSNPDVFFPFFTNAIPRITAGWAISQDPPYAIHIGALDPWGGLYVYKLEIQKDDYGILWNMACLMIYRI
jgi:hypothetical protein